MFNLSMAGDQGLLIYSWKALFFTCSNTVIVLSRSQNFNRFKLRFLLVNILKLRYVGQYNSYPLLKSGLKQCSLHSKIAIFELGKCIFLPNILLRISSADS